MIPLWVPDGIADVLMRGEIRVRHTFCRMFQRERWHTTRTYYGLWMDSADASEEWAERTQDATGVELWRANYLTALLGRVAEQGRAAYLATWRNETDIADEAWDKMVTASQRVAELMAEIDAELPEPIVFCLAA